MIFVFYHYLKFYVTVWNQFIQIEGILTQVPLVSQLFLYGESTESKLVAVIVPDMDAVAVWRKKNPTSSAPSSSSFPSTSFSVLPDTTDLVPIILEQMKEEGKRHGLKGYELVYAGTLTLIITTVHEKMKPLLEESMAALRKYHALNSQQLMPF